MEKKTYTYKVVDGVEVKADVYRPSDADSRPVIVSLHGGCLINGSRLGFREDLCELAQERDYVLVPVDYRLGPEVKVPAIIEDIQDAFRWIRRDGPELFGADPDRIVAVGSSAGGYLTMMTGICVDPPPVALVSYFGYGSIDGPWYSQPCEYYRRNRPIVSQTEALSAVGRGVLTGTVWESDIAQARSRYYHYLRQNGLWTREMTGFDPAREKDKLDPYCPVRNITPRYPPIVMIHGTADTDVPSQESAAMAKELERQGVQHEFFAIDGAEHGLRDGDQEMAARACARAREFIIEHLG